MRRPSVVSVILTCFSICWNAGICFSASSSFSLSCWQILAVQREGFPGARVGGAGLPALSRGIQEISADGLLHFLAGAQQPQNDEQRHHRRDEVGVSYLPRAPMRIIVVAGVLLYDDDRSV